LDKPIRKEEKHKSQNTKPALLLVLNLLKDVDAIALESIRELLLLNPYDKIKKILASVTRWIELSSLFVEMYLPKHLTVCSAIIQRFVLIVYRLIFDADFDNYLNYPVLMLSDLFRQIRCSFDSRKNALHDLALRKSIFSLQVNVFKMLQLLQHCCYTNYNIKPLLLHMHPLLLCFNQEEDKHENIEAFYANVCKLFTVKKMAQESFVTYKHGPGYAIFKLFNSSELLGPMHQFHPGLKSYFDKSSLLRFRFEQLRIRKPPQPLPERSKSSSWKFSERSKSSLKRFELVEPILKFPELSESSSSKLKLHEHSKSSSLK